MKIGILWYKVQTKEGAKYNIIFNFFIALKQAKNPFVFFKKKKKSVCCRRSILCCHFLDS
jgi:hypothetical protein